MQLTKQEIPDKPSTVLKAPDDQMRFKVTLLSVGKIQMQDVGTNKKILNSNWILLIL